MIMKIPEGLKDSAQNIGVGLPKKVLIEMLGRSRLLIENHKGIRCYNNELIVIDTPQGVLEVKGKGLSLKIMMRHKLLICGFVFELCFPETEK